MNTIIIHSSALSNNNKTELRKAQVPSHIVEIDNTKDISILNRIVLVDSLGNTEKIIVLKTTADKFVEDIPFQYVIAVD